MGPDGCRQALVCVRECDFTNDGQQLPPGPEVGLSNVAGQREARVLLGNNFGKLAPIGVCILSREGKRHIQQIRIVSYTQKERVYTVPRVPGRQAGREIIVRVVWLG